MSYQPPYLPPPGPMSVPPQAPRQRPGSVLAGVVFMFTVAALGVITAAITLAAIGQIVNRFRNRASLTAATPEEIDNLAAGIQVLTIGLAILILIFALVLAGLAFGVQRGSNVARILTWVLVGLGILCNCCGLFGAIGQTNVSTFGTPDMNRQTADQLARALQDAYPSWWLGFSGGLSGLQLLGYIAIAILLALPSANAFFRRPVPQWQPPPPAM